MKCGFLRLPPRRLALLGLTGAFFLALLWGAVRYREALSVVLTPFLVSLALAYLLSPAVAMMERRRISRTASIISLYLVFAIVVLIFCVRVMPPLLDDLQKLAMELPRYAVRLQEIIDYLQENYRRFNLPPNIREIVDNNIAGMERALSAQLERTYSFLLGLFSRVLLLLLVPVLTYYLLRDEEPLKKRLVQAIPGAARPRFLAACGEINKALGSFIRGSILVSLVVGLLSYTAFIIIGLDFPLILAFIAGITNLIPFIGPIIGAIPVLMVSLLESPLQAFRALALIVIVQQVESQFIYPLIIGRSTGFHPLVVILTLLVGARLFGFAGLLLAMPVAIILRIIAAHLLDAWHG